MKDWQTGSEVDAGKADRAQAWADWQDERDEPPFGVHLPCDVPNCMVCVVLPQVIAEQKEERRAWDEYKASQRDEEAS